jgi:hypothetical protein
MPLSDDMSECRGITVAGFCREDRATFFSLLDRVSGGKEFQRVKAVPQGDK